MIIKTYYLVLSLLIILPLTLLVGFFTGNLSNSMSYMQLFVLIIGLISMLYLFRLLLKYKVGILPIFFLHRFLYRRYVKLSNPLGVRLYFFIYFFIVIVLLYFLIKTVRILFL